ncbi:hypothetical protein AB0B45_31070 [Nonomuraea sp. NPDC049152]|uniref:hypothetical protein n=1 Tax=Nonomuraea sp. NPDC049152 TaxID=3154350 RepID=UPI0033D3F6EB
MPLALAAIFLSAAPVLIGPFLVVQVGWFAYVPMPEPPVWESIAWEALSWLERVLPALLAALAIGRPRWLGPLGAPVTAVALALEILTPVLGTSGALNWPTIACHAAALAALVVLWRRPLVTQPPGLAAIAAWAVAYLAVLWPPLANLYPAIPPSGILAAPGDGIILELTWRNILIETGFFWAAVLPVMVAACHFTGRRVAGVLSGLVLLVPAVLCGLSWGALPYLVAAALVPLGQLRSGQPR